MGKRPLKQGRDWHAWAVRLTNEEGEPFAWWAIDSIPPAPESKSQIELFANTRWVRIRFIEVWDTELSPEYII